MHEYSTMNSCAAIKQGSKLVPMTSKYNIQRSINC